MGSLAVAISITITIGLWLRWALAGHAPLLAVPFANLRHAHSHLGYFGVLFPLAWLGWRAAGVRLPSFFVLALYAVSTGMACAGFVMSGYGALAIAGSTAVAAIWLYSSLPLFSRIKNPSDLLSVVPLGIIASLACVPPVAIFLRSDPELARGFVATFLSGLLFLVIVPSALASRGIQAGPWPLFFVAGVLASLCLGVFPSLPTRVFLLVYAGLLSAPVRRTTLDTHLRIVWALVALGFVALALGALPNLRPVALGATHFLILGPVLGTLAPTWLAPFPTWWWCIGHLSWGGMSAALVAQAFTANSRTWFFAALGGTIAVLWWALTLLHTLLSRKNPQT